LRAHDGARLDPVHERAHRCVPHQLCFGSSGEAVSASVGHEHRVVHLVKKSTALLIVQDARVGDRVERREQLALCVSLPDAHRRRISAAAMLRGRIASPPLVGLPVHGLTSEQRHATRRRGARRPLPQPCIPM
jgi:hypothetical protein